MSDQIQREASDKAGLIVKYIAVLFGNFCAISAIYFAVRNEFVMPQSLQVLGIWVAIWVILVLLVHLLLKPWLEKRYVAKLSAGGPR